MRKVIYYILIGMFIIGIPLLAFAIVNTMVSIKYETADAGDCISSVSGVNLCLTIMILKGLVAVCVIGLISLIIFRKKILKQK